MSAPSSALVTDPERTWWYATLHTALGPLTLGATERGLCCVHFGPPNEDWLAAQARLYVATPEPDDAPLAKAAVQLSEYLAGRRRAFDLPLDLSLGTPFQQRVLEGRACYPLRSDMHLWRFGQGDRITQGHASRGRGVGTQPAAHHRAVSPHSGCQGALGGFSSAVRQMRFIITRGHTGRHKGWQKGVAPAPAWHIA